MPAVDSVKAWRSRIIGHGEESPGQLLANPRNWRIHPQAQQDALGGLLDQVGWVQDVIVNRTTGHVVDGHLRVSLAISRNEPTVPVVYVELTEAEEGLVLAAIDPIAAMAATDDEALRMLLADVVVDSQALQAMLDAVPKAAKEGRTEPDDLPEERDETTVQRGDVYMLGKHRLMCGDSTSPEDVALLLAGAAPALMITDPPYGVEYDPEWRAKAGINKNIAKMGAVQNDDRSDWREAWDLFSGDVAYVWHASLHTPSVFESLVASRFGVRANIVWAKDRFALSQGHYHWQHEPCWYAVRHGATANWVGDRKQTTVWQIPARDDSGHGHGTQKPVECMERPLRNHTGDVYDPFAGSGTTIIAAERQSRVCYAMELEPKYVQVCIDRWEAYTGGTALKLS